MTDRAHKLRYPRSASRDRYAHDDAAGGSTAPAFGMPGDPAAVEAMILERAMRRQPPRNVESKAHGAAYQAPPLQTRESMQGNYVNEIAMASQRVGINTAGTVQYVAQLEHQMASLEAEHARLCRVMLRHVSRNAAAELELEEAEARRDLVNAAMASNQRITTVICREMAELAMTLSARASLSAIALEADRPSKSLACMMRDVELAQQSLNTLLQETRRESTALIGRASTSTELCNRAAEDLRQEVDRFLRQTGDDHQASRAALTRGFASCVDAVQSCETALSIRVQAVVQAAAGGTDTAVANVTNAVGALHNEVRQLTRDTQRVIMEEAQESNRQLSALHEKLRESLTATWAHLQQQQQAPPPAAVITPPSSSTGGDLRTVQLLSAAALRHLDQGLALFAAASADKALYASALLTSFANRTPAVRPTLSSDQQATAKGGKVLAPSRGVQTDSVVTRSVLLSTVTVETSSRAAQSDSPPATYAIGLQTDHQQLATFSGSGNSFDLAQTYFPPPVMQSFGVVSAPTMPPSPSSSKLSSPSVSFSMSKSGTGGIRTAGGGGGGGGDTPLHGVVSRSPGKSGSSNGALPAARGVPAVGGHVAPLDLYPPRGSNATMPPPAASSTSSGSQHTTHNSPGSGSSKPPLSSNAAAAAAAAMAASEANKSAGASSSIPAAATTAAAAVTVGTAGGGDGSRHRSKTPPMVKAAPSTAAKDTWDSSDTEDMDVSIDASTDEGSPSPSTSKGNSNSTGEGSGGASKKSTHAAAAAAVKGSAGDGSSHLLNAVPANMPLIAISRDSVASSSDHTPTPSARHVDHPDFGTFVLPPSGEYFSMSLNRDNELPIAASAAIPPLALHESAESSAPGQQHASPSTFGMGGGKLKKTSSFDSMSPGNSFRSPRNRTIVFLGDDGGDVVTSPSPRNSLTTFPAKVNVPGAASIPGQSPKNNGGGAFSPRGSGASSASPTMASPRKTGPPGLPVVITDRSASPSAANTPLGTFSKAPIPTGSVPPPLGPSPSSLSSSSAATVANASTAPKKKALPALGFGAKPGAATATTTIAPLPAAAAKRAPLPTYGDFDD